MKLSFKDFFSKCQQIRSFLRIWSHLLKKPLMENFIFCEVCVGLTYWMVCSKPQPFTFSKLLFEYRKILNRAEALLYLTFFFTEILFNVNLIAQTFIQNSKSCPEEKKNILKKFTNLKGKQLCRSLFLNKV